MDISMILVQLCGLVNMFFLLIIFFTSKKLKLRGESLFKYLMIASTVNLILDIGSIVCIVLLPKESMIVWLICKTYLVSLVLVGALGFLYVTEEVVSYRVAKIINICFVTVFTIAAVCIFALPIEYEYNQINNVVYTTGTSVTCTYLFTMPFILATIATVFIFKKKLNTRRFEAVTLWMWAWLGAAIVQFFNPDLLLVGFASSVGMIILYIMLENPDANYDRIYGHFNNYALGEFIKKKFDEKKNFGIISIELNNNSVDEKEYLTKLFAMLKSLNGVTIFKNAGPQAVIVHDESFDEAKFYQHFDDTFEQEAKYFYIVSVTSALDAINSHNLFAIIESSNHKLYRTSRKYRMVINKEDISDYLRNEQMEEEIISALAEDRVEVFFQPIYSTSKNRFTSAEALTRIRGKDGKLIMPGLFIPVAEETGRIVEIGDVVFEKTCKFLQEYRNQLGLEYIEVNLSVVQCEKTNLADKIISTMEKYETDPSWINLEITESAAIDKNTLFMGNMKRLLDYGVSFSLDDFGKGESNLMYLIDMPVSIVKFDRDMMRAYNTDKKAHEVIDAAIDMIHNLKLHIVAEGIETSEEVNDVCENGIDYIQGYFFSKPLPIPEFIDFVKKSR